MVLYKENINTRRISWLCSGMNPAHGQPHIVFRAFIIFISRGWLVLFKEIIMALFLYYAVTWVATHRLQRVCFISGGWMMLYKENIMALFWY